MKSTKATKPQSKKELSYAESQNVTGERVSKTVIDQASPTHALLSEMNLIDVESVGHRELVVTSRIKSSLTGEQDGVTTVPNKGLGQRYASVTGLFGKIYAQILMTHEVIHDSHIDIESEVVRLAGDDFLDVFIEELLNGDESRADGIQRLRGILNSRIDKPQGFSEALKEDDERHQDYFKVIKTGFTGSFGDTPEAIRKYMTSLKKSVPTKYKRNAKWYMNAEVFESLENVTDSTGQSLLIKWGRPVYGGEETYLMLGHPVVIIDQMGNQGADATPLMFGDLRSAMKVLNLKGDQSYFTTDHVTVKGASIVYFDSRYGEIMQSNNALRVALQAA